MSADIHAEKTRFVITGASGFIGSQLVPILHQNGHKLLLVGRNIDRLKQQFPDMECCEYHRLSKAGHGYDALLHLAVLNNNVTADASAFHHVNVSFLGDVLEKAKAAQIPHFFNFASFHILDDAATPYASTKRDAAEMVRQAEGIAARNIVLPAIYGDRFAGKLSPLNRLPKFLQKIGFSLLAPLAPTLNINRLGDFLTSETALSDRRDNLLLADPKENQFVYRWFKRLVDIAFVLFVGLALPWLLLIVWLLVVITSKGPGIFAQKRVGQNGVIFTCYKFRTMKRGTAQAGTHEITTDSVTGIGHFLRKTKIDELPQIINILRGELSLIGPRPCLPSQTELINCRNVHDVLRLKPGITGLSQIKGIDMSDPERLAISDAEYLKRRSVLLDIKILIGTIVGRGGGDRVKS